MDTYLTLKAAHLISMVAWFAALFYLPRQFVYHVEHPEAAPTLTLMEGKLAAYIMRPAAAATILFGLALLAMNPALFQEGWLHTKLALVTLLLVYHGSLEILTQRFRNNQNTRSGRFYRLYNEIPTLLLITIVLLAVTKPY